MRAYRPLLLLSPLLLLAACARPEGAAQAPNAGANEQAEPAAASRDVDPAAVVGMAGGNIVAMAGAMAAMVEFCGLSGAETRAQTLANLDKEMSAKGLSSADVERLFDQGYEATKAKVASDPAKAQADCAPMKQMADPAEIKKLQQAARDAEAMAAKLKQQGG